MITLPDELKVQGRIPGNLHTVKALRIGTAWYVVSRKDIPEAALVSFAVPFIGATHKEKWYVYHANGLAAHSFNSYADAVAKAKEAAAVWDNVDWTTITREQRNATYTIFKGAA